MAGTTAADVYLEVGAKRVAAGAVDWPGWCRFARDEAGALEALVAYGPRYADVLRGSRLGFRAPRSVDQLRVVERLRGNATTDFGAPDVAPRADGRPFDAAELERSRRVLRASWAALDAATRAAQGIELRQGPRGGGRDLEAIVAHVIEAEAGYLRRIAGTPPRIDQTDRLAARDAVRRAVLGALERASREGVPETGPRGGAMWRPRSFVRRTAWHALDHAWEIRDRSA